MPPRRAFRKTTPKISSKSNRRVTRSGAPSSAAEDDHPEASPGGATEIGGTQVGNEDRDSEEAVEVETATTPAPDVLGALPEDAAEVDGIQKGNEGQSQTCDAIVTDNANLSCGNSIDDDDGARSPIAKESDAGKEVAVDGEGICIVNEPNLDEEVPVDDQKLGNGVDRDSCLSGDGVLGDKNLGNGGTEGASEKDNSDSGGVPQDQSNGEAVEDKNLTRNGDCNNVQAKNLSGQDVDGENDLDAEMKHDSDVVEDGDAVGEGEDQGNELISDDEGDDDLSSNPGAEHNSVEEESPGAKTEGGDVGEEDDEEEYDYEESENDEDNYEEGEEDGDDYVEGEDNEGKNEESKEDKSSDKSADLSEKRRTKGLEIHIGGLDKETVEDDLVKVFRKFGEIQSARIIRQSSRKAKGFAFVQYSTAEQAKNAVSELKDGVEVRGKRVKVSASWENATLFIDNICKSWTKEHVLNTLKDYGIGHIEEMHLPDDPENKGQSKGFAFLEFSTHMDAVAAHQRLGKADAIFGCDRSAEVAFMRNQVPSTEDLTEIKAAISRRRGRLQKPEHGGSKVKKSSERTRPRKKTEALAIAKSQGGEKERERTHQASSSKSKGKGIGKKGKAVSEVERKPMRTKISESKSHRPNSSVTENRVVRVPLKSTTTRHKRKPLPLERDDRGKRKPLPLERDERGKRKVGNGYDDRPSKNLRGNKQSTPRRAIRSPRSNPRMRERPAHAYSAISGSKRHHSDMEPHAGYVEPAALKQVKRQARYHESDLGNHSKRHVKYLEPDLGNRHQSHYLEPAFENRHQGRVSYREPAHEDRYQSRLSYREPPLESRHQTRLSYREPALEVRYHVPSLVREALPPHGGYLEPPAARVESHYDYRHRPRRDDDGYNNQISSSSTNPRALPSYAPSPRFPSYSRYEGDNSSRGGGYHHKSYLPRR